MSLWTDVPQIGGPGQAARNYLMLAAERQIVLGCDSNSEHIAELWLRALNAPWLVVHGPESREYFHWYSQPQKFAALPIAWDNGAGDRIYRLPFEPHEAVVVDYPSMPHITSTADESFLTAYVKWSAGRHPISLHWTSSGEATFDADLNPGQAVLLKINYDPGWHASDATIARDPIGFQLIRAQPGPHHIALRFGASWDTWLGRTITLITIVLLIARVKPVCIAAAALIPAIIAWAVLTSRTPPTAHIAEDAFIHLHPPLINNGGIVNLERGGIAAIYGTDLGAPPDTVRVWIGDRAVPVEFHSPTQINLRWPKDAPASAPVSVEVNGCIGNAFTVATR